MRHYVFGYGSLICSESRAKTAEALGGSIVGQSDVGIPVRLLGWVRVWNVRGHNTYLGVQSVAADSSPISDEKANASIGKNGQQAHSCVGVLFPLPASTNGDYEKALSALDQREIAYTRQSVNLRLIQTVDDLLIERIEEEDVDGKSESKMERQTKQIQLAKNQYYKDTFLYKKMNDDANSILGKQPRNNEDNAYKTEIARINDDHEETKKQEITETAKDKDTKVCVWIYVPKAKYMGMARAENPILQSYVDVCIKGCLSISKAFAKEFVEGTYGWYPGHHSDVVGNQVKSNIDDKDTSNDGSDISSCWIDDRIDPKYIRANKTYSLDHSEALDAVFSQSLLRRRR